MQRCIKEFTAHPASRSQSPIVQQVLPTLNVKLPEIKIAPFSGKFEEWSPFIQLFETLIIDNATLSNVQRFLYLKSLLKDEPLQIISSLLVTNDNFDVAISLLRKRYENQLILISSLFNALIDSKPVVKPNAQNLREFVMTLRTNLDQIYNLNYSDAVLLNLLIMHISVRKLDFGTRKLFERERDITELPSVDRFLNFLEKQSTILENLTSDDSNSNTSKQKSNRVSLHSSKENETQVNQSQVFCTYCSE